MLKAPKTLCLSFPPQTYIGSIVASVNPYKIIPGLYDRTAVELYSRHHLGEISPHIFAVANECYRCLWKRHDNQCVLIRYPNRVLITPAAELCVLQREENPASVWMWGGERCSWFFPPRNNINHELGGGNVALQHAPNRSPNDEAVSADTCPVAVYWKNLVLHTRQLGPVLLDSRSLSKHFGTPLRCSLLRRGLICHHWFLNNHVLPKPPPPPKKDFWEACK